jgi:F-box/TPR repeat protein Pof3
MDLDLTGARKRVPWTAVRTYIHQSKVALTRANIHEIAAAATLKVLDMLSRCPHLEHLEMHIPHDNPPEFYAKIKTFKRLKTLVCTDVKISHGCVGGILSDLPLLEKATFGNIWESWQSRENGDLAWPKHLPNLKSLTIGCSHRDPSRPLIPFSLSNVIPRLGSVSFPFFII